VQAMTATISNGGTDMRRYSAQEPNPEHWSKDFVEHLRTVHFTLVTVSVGLIALLSAKTYDARRAASEMNELAGFTSKPLLVAPTLRVTKANSDEIPYSRLFEAKSKGRVYQFSIGEPNLYQCGNPDFEGNPLRAIGYSLSAHTIGSVKQIVDSSSDLPLFSIETIKRAGTTDDGNGNTEPLIVTRPINVLDAPYGADLKLAVDCPIGAVKGLVVHNENIDFGDGRRHTVRFNVTVSVQEQPWVLPVGFVGHRASLQPLYGNLLEAARGREDLDFSILAPQIYEEVEKGDEPFEAFGLKIPESRIAVWGIVILISIQLYFVMYMRRLSNKLKPDDPGWDVPWMAMDQSILARAMLFVSIVVLPACATFAVIAHAMESGNSRGENIEAIVVTCGFLLSWVLDYLSWRYRPKLRAPSVPPQLFE
jgi:hypothetical protein